MSENINSEVVQIHISGLAQQRSRLDKLALENEVNRSQMVWKLLRTFENDPQQFPSEVRSKLIRYTKLYEFDSVSDFVLAAIDNYYETIKPDLKLR